MYAKEIKLNNNKKKHLTQSWQFVKLFYIN